MDWTGDRRERSGRGWRNIQEARWTGFEDRFVLRERKGSGNVGFLVCSRRGWLLVMLPTEVGGTWWEPGLRRKFMGSHSV